jgi:hypothetical protein
MLRKEMMTDKAKHTKLLPMGKEGMEYMEQNESQSSQNISCYIEIN